jgi:acid phosphatase (class A)
MKRALLSLLTAASLAGLPAAAFAQDATAPVGSGQGRAEHPAAKPYLEALPDMIAAIGPPPAPGSAAAASDLASYWTTRALAGGPRWALATRDAVSSTPALLADFSCAFGRRVEPTAVPHLASLLDRVRIDASRTTRIGKDHYRRVRPHVGNTAPICVEREPRVDSDFAYPSGHATLGWTVALVLASAAPEHAAAILARGRVYGESRIVCGVHWRSDVEAGRTNAAATVAALQGNAGFRADLEEARTELKAALAAAGPADPESETCKVERDAASVGGF